MQLIARLSRTKVARIIGLALLAAMAITYVASTKAATPVEFTVRVFEGDPANHVMVGGANILLVADDRSNPSHGLSATTDSMGLAVFSAVEPGAFNVEIRHPNYYGKDYHIMIDSNTELDATLVSLTTQPNPPGPTPDVCTPTPPRGQPMFNIWPIAETGANCTDYPLLAAQNVTRSGAYTHNLSASAGDTIKVRLYVHNGVLDYPENEAINAMVAAHLPAASGTITAEAWANNATRVNSAQKGGDVNLSLGANEFLEYVPGSAKVYSRGPSLIGAFPDSVVSGGASLGNMRGCYEFLRFVTFEATVKTRVVPPSGNISIQKTVRNLSRGETTFVDQTAASPAEQVEFQMKVTASGAVNNVNVSDNLPGLLSFNTGSLTVDGAASGNNLGSIGLGNMNNNTKTIQFRAQVASSSQFSGTTVLTNTAAVSSDSGSAQDSASVVVSIVPPTIPVLSIQKTVRNVSRSETAFVESTTASPTEQVEFQIAVTASGATANNVTVADSLPADLHLNFITNSNGSGSTLNSIPLGNIAAGTTKTFKITASAGSETSFPVGTTTLTNIATAFADNAASRSDTASVIVIRNVVVNPNLNIEKTVRNVSRGESQFTKTTAAVGGEQVEFEIRVTAGAATARNVVMTDTLPDHFTLGFVNMDSGINRDSNLVFRLGDMTAGTTKTVKITATADSESSFPVGTTSWINRAVASADNVGSVSSEAKVNVTRGSIAQNAQLNIVKLVRNINSGNSFSHSTAAQTNDILEFQITVSNVGGATANNVRVSDTLPSQVTYRDATMRLNGNYSGSNFLSSILNVSLGNLAPGQSAAINFQVTVLAVNNIQTTVTNTATASADNAGTVSDSASVFLSSVRGTNVDLTLSKRAYNNTQNVDATTVTARPGDVITYTLSVQNSGSADATSYVFQDDVSDILQLSELGNFSGGNFDVGHLTLTWPAVAIPAGGRVDKIFTVTVRETFPAGTDFVMTNVFGNTVNVRVRGPFTAPATGNPATLSLVLSGLVAASYAAYRRGKSGLLAKFFRNN